VNPGTEDSRTPQLQRTLTLFDATMINVGTIIASGIFFVPATIAHLVPFSGLILLAWMVAGLVSLLGALSIAELGAAMPRAGGMYIYLREAYGPVWGFLYGWSAFAVTNTASIAAIAVGFATYLGFFLPLDTFGVRLVAVLSIIALTLLNCGGLKLGAWTQNILTVSKLGAFGVLILFSVILRGGSVEHFDPLLPSIPVSGFLGPFGLALVAALWAYDGWIEITFVSGEVREPQTTIPRSILYSTITVMIVYVVVNMAYLYVLSATGMAASTLVASDAAVVLIGGTGAGVIACAVMVSTLGSNNGIIFTAARVPYAMAREGEFFRVLGAVHPKFRTPHMALIVQGILACLLTLTGTYTQLITYIIFAEFLFYGLAAAAVVVLRRQRKDLVRPYKVWGYPIPPLLFVLCAAGLVVNTIIEDPRDSLIGGGIIALGLPAYLIWSKRKVHKEGD
jgi:APA family basic amino acid/polyamine antiporter